MSSSFSLTTAQHYRQELLQAITSAQRRVILHAMDIRWSDSLQDIISALEEAAKRGLEVHIVADIYTKFEALSPFSRTHGYSWSKICAVNDRLRRAGCSVTYVGALGINPYKKRTHSKALIADSTVFTFGGINLTEDSFGYHDYMLGTHNDSLADRLHTLIRHMEQHPLADFPDIREEIGNTGTLLFDGGMPGTSVIYDTACEVLASARRAYFVSQMCPSGRLAQALSQTTSECYFVRPGQTTFPASMALWFDQRRFRVKNAYKRSGYIHAKFILTEDKDGSKHLISGTHNFSWRGVAYGTKEIALHSTDPALWQQLFDFMQQEVVGSA